MIPLCLPGIHHYFLPQVPGLIAGEYPGHQEGPKALERVRILRRVGVTLFIDLTEVGELVPYAPLLEAIENGPGPVAVHRRFPIRDVRVPHPPSSMSAILDEIDRARAEGHLVYLHCWGGVGRTGTVAGCYLVRQGLSGEEALAEVGRLFAQTEKGRGGRVAPETQAQAEFIRRWRDTERQGVAGPSRTEWSNRLAGALMGLAVGDALGTTVEFRPPGTFEPVTTIVGGGPFQLAPGQWTDDTSMALCLADSLIERGGFDPNDQMRRYVRWYREGYRSSTGECFDIGNTVRAALHAFESTGEPFAGRTDPHSAGNGSLMRVAPIAIFYADRPAEAVEWAGESSRTTHGAAAAVDACRFMVALMLGAFRGVPKTTLLSPEYVERLGYWHRRPLDPAIATVAAGSFRRKEPPAIRGTGYVVESLEAALWAFFRTESFEEGALAAVNLGNDADTTGAVYGQLAGAYYGLDALPTAWRQALHQGSAILGVAEILARPTPALSA